MSINHQRLYGLVNLHSRDFYLKVKIVALVKFGWVSIVQGIRFLAVTTGCCNCSRPFNFKLMAEIILLCETVIKSGPMNLISTAEICYSVQLRVIFTATNPNP